MAEEKEVQKDESQTEEKRDESPKDAQASKDKAVKESDKKEAKAVDKSEAKKDEKPKPLKKVAPKKVAPKKVVPKASIGPADEPISRRSFLSWLSFGWIAFVGAIGGLATMMGRFMFPNVLFEKPQTFKAGYPEDFPIGVSTSFEGEGVWIVKTNDQMYVLSTTCTHLGCTPNWLPNDRKFKCPCHGSGFRMTGINFEGPAPRPLERFRIVLADDGQILIDKTKKYQQEKGQWSDPESFLVL